MRTGGESPLPVACLKSLFPLAAALCLSVLPTVPLLAAESVAYQLNPMHSGGVDGAKFPPNFGLSWSLDLDGAVECPIIAEGRAFISVDGATGGSFPSYGS